MPTGGLQPTQEEREKWGCSAVEADNFDDDLAAVLIDKTTGALRAKTVANRGEARNNQKKRQSIIILFRCI